jgi:hypothetical protein
MTDRPSRPVDVGVMAAQGIRHRSLPSKLTIDAGEVQSQGTRLRRRMIGASARRRARRAADLADGRLRSARLRGTESPGKFEI